MAYFCSQNKTIRTVSYTHLDVYKRQVHTSPEGDTFIPAIDPDKWELIGREDHYADEKNEFDYSFLDYRLKAE